MLKRIMSTQATRWTFLIRVAVGCIFLSEGIQKFLFPDDVGAGRFARIGLPEPQILGPFVGGVEVLCGMLMLAGFLTRVAAVGLLIIMSVALISTKVPILVNDGFWKMAHAARTDFSMFMSSLFLLIVGAGLWSVDAKVGKKPSGETRPKR